MFYFHCWCCPFNAEVNNYRNTSLMWVLMRSRVVSYRIVLPLCRFQTADSVPLISIIQPNQSSQIPARCSMQQHFPIWRAEHIHLVVMRPFSQPTTSHYRLMAPEIFIPCIQSEISDKDSNWRMTTDSVKVSYADSNSRGTSRPPHCVFFHLYTAELSCFFFIPVKFNPLHRWMVILHMAKQWDQQMWK